MDAALAVLGSWCWRLGWELLLYGIGWAVLRLISLGRYPRQRAQAQGVDYFWEAQCTSLVGLCTVALGLLAWAHFG